MEGTRSPVAASVLELSHESSFTLPSARSHALLVTYKRDSGAVPTPVWFWQRVFEVAFRPVTQPVHYIESVPAP